MSKSIWRDKDTNKFLLIEVLFGILIALAVWYWTGKDTTSFVWGIVCMAIVWLILLRVHSGQTAHDLSTNIEQLKDQVESAIDLKLDALADKELSESIRFVFSAASKSLNCAEDPLMQYTISRIKQFGSEMHRVASGEIRVPSDVAWRLALTYIESSSGIFATTFSSRRAFWSTDAGLEYLEANRKAVKSGADIIRVFILDGDEESDQYLLFDVIAQHIDIGMGVWILNGSDVDHAKLVDIAVFDDRVVSIWESPRPESQISNVRWLTSEDGVELYQELRRYFEFRARKITTQEELNAWIGRAPSAFGDAKKS